MRESAGLTALTLPEDLPAPAPPSTDATPAPQIPPLAPRPILLRQGGAHNQIKIP